MAKNVRAPAWDELWTALDDRKCIPPKVQASFENLREENALLQRHINDIKNLIIGAIDARDAHLQDALKQGMQLAFKHGPD